mmetsp:Transcript_5613/g.25289  ORF Transcript_5613/g.25289 Transcript_5613/m.25289 type:complete len:259 (-) Transcript_5613:532-1308(-)
MCVYRTAPRRRPLHVRVGTRQRQLDVFPPTRSRPMRRPRPAPFLVPILIHPPVRPLHDTALHVPNPNPTAAVAVVLGHVQREHPGEDGDEPASLARNFPGALVKIVSKHNGRRGERERREHDVVYRRHHRGVEHIECLVQVVHLRHHARADDRRADPRLRLEKLVPAGERELQRGAQRFARHHAQGPDERAYPDRDQDVVGAVCWVDARGEVGGESHGQGGVRHEPGPHGHREEFFYSLDLLLLRRVQHDLHAPDDAQ